MKLKSITKNTGITLLSFLISGNVFAYTQNNRFINDLSARLSTFTLDCAHYYVGANAGISHLHDNSNPGSITSVDENGPGGSIVVGYQFNSIVGAELGYTQYYNSRETTASTIIAKTTHFSTDLAGTARYPLMPQWSILGKLGVAYSYAQKMATGAGTAKSSGSVSPYWGIGLDYSVTPTVDFIAQVAEAIGNNYTGSADLWSLGVVFAIV